MHSYPRRESIARKVKGSGLSCNTNSSALPSLSLTFPKSCPTLDRSLPLDEADWL